MKRLYALILLLFSLILPFDGQDGIFLRAQGNDPVLAGMIFQYTDKVKKELRQQEQMMQLVSTGHIWIKEEVEGTTNLQKEFNNYLDRFNSIISYAAQIYGFYHEIDRLVAQLGTYSHQLSHQTTNALAVALSANRNKLYRELIMSSVEIVNDVRQVCLSNNKMTEKQRTGDSLWHTTETQTDEPETQTVDTGSEVHQTVRRMGRDRLWSQE